MRLQRVGTVVGLIAMLSACGGGGSNSSGATASSSGPAATPAPTSGGCTLRARQDWVAAQMKEWYLFPETLPVGLDPSPYKTASDYLDALTANARAQGRDRFFTYLTSIKQENAYQSSGATAGFGVRLSFDSSQRVFIAEAFEGAPALAAGIDRGTEILAIGTTANDLRTVSSIIAGEGGGGITAALGDNVAGTTRVLKIADANGTVRTVTVTKADYDLPPVSSRYGAQIITDNGQQYGYVNLRTFISAADPALRAAFAKFRAAGITQVIVDFRYNGGGAVSIAELFGDLLGGDRSSSDVFDYITFRPEKSSENSTAYFMQQPQSVAATRIAFIGTQGTASASELVINGFLPFLGKNVGLIGTNTYGKPVGQIALDLAQCDDRLRVIAFKLQNAARQGDYFNGLASTVPSTCRASDDLMHPMGDPQEASTRQALDFLEGKTCTPIVLAEASVQARDAAQINRKLLTPDRPNTAQREVPGLF